MPHGHNIYAKASDMAKAKMCAYPQSDNALPHWKCVFRCCDRFPSINLPDKETNDQYSSTIPSIIFHIYHIIARCTTHGGFLLNDRKICSKCKHDSVSEQSTKINTRKELVMIKTTISNFHTSFYIPEIQKLAFLIPHVQILGANHCGDSLRTAFKRCESFKDVLCRRDCADRVVASFSHQIQSE